MSIKSIKTLIYIVAIFSLFFALIHAARPQPSIFYKNPSKNQSKGDNVTKNIEMDESICEGIGQEECLMRRTLEAHLDYIYTQKQNP